MRYGAAHPSVRPPPLENLLAFRQRDTQRAKYGGLWRTPESWQPSPVSYLEERQELRAPREAMRQGSRPPAPMHKLRNQALARAATSHCTNGVTGTHGEPGELVGSDTGRERGSLCWLSA